jgi:hypothetical protein
MNDRKNMNKLTWTPWHQVVQIRDDLKSGELSMSTFAADLYDVVMKKGQRPVYEDPAEFFALTYPTYNLRELAKDVVTRLAGKNDKAVRQLELTYGGGKTHTLITLFHLVENPATLPNLPSVEEFVNHIGMRPPQARIAVLAFDKLDVEKGMEVRGPDGKTRWLKNPWSVMAYQLAGADGLKLLHAEGKDAERESAPAENLLAELLGLPGKQDLSTLILIDEVLMYAREKVGMDSSWRSKIVNFFQYLTQAATKVDRCAIVASLLATDPAKSDTLGKELMSEMYAIFRREREEGVQPVLKEDVAEVLRRRFFKPDSIRDREAFRPHVVAALKGIADLDDQTRKDGNIAEARFLLSYPFHPDLTEVFYTKWTSLEGFQRTRGILRTFALALRDSEKWDQSPLVGANAFLGEPDAGGISEAARELTSVAASEQYEGKRQEWTAILEGELGKARDIQSESAGLSFREIEQAVFATFLHSQPIGQKAFTRDLMLVLGHTRPDKIELEKALLRWTEVSWFLDEEYIVDSDSGGRRQLPALWRLGSKPNLRQMHHDASLRVSPDLVDARLLEDIGKCKPLTAGASAAGARVHSLPEKPSYIDDDGEFRFGVLGPKAASDSGKPSAEAARFIDETTGADRPRVYRNAVVLAVPSRDGLEAARKWIRDYLGWEEVRSQLKDHEVDPIREATLSANLDKTRKSIPEAIQHAYSIVVTVSEKDEVQAFKVTVQNGALFATIKEDKRSRIQDTAVSAEALLPDGPYNLWHEGETARRVKDLVNAFAQFSRLPKMLNRKAILDTLVAGSVEGRFVLRLTRPDKSVKTYWREAPDEAALKEPGLEVVLAEAAELSQLPSPLLVPTALPQLWAGQEVSVQQVREYFAGGHVVKIAREGYEEPIVIPKAERSLIEEAIQEAVRDGRLWLTSGPSSVLGEEIPAGILSDQALLHAPPPPIAAADLLPENLPDAWQQGAATALGISNALSNKAEKVLPWLTVRRAIDGALSGRLLERVEGQWPCEYANAQSIGLRVPAERPEVPPPPPLPRPGVRVAEAELRPNEIQDLADSIGELIEAAAGHELRFRLRIELDGADSLSDEAVEKISSVLGEVSKDLTLK